LATLGVSSGDQTTIRGVLDSFQPLIVRTICEKYQYILKMNQTAVMYAFVLKVAGIQVTDPPIEIYFNGVKPPGSTNFLAQNAQGLADRTRHFADLVAFFGKAIGCDDPTFPTYVGVTDQRALHQRMMIPAADFVEFVNNFITGMTEVGLDQGDGVTIRAYLNSFQSDIVYQPTNSTPSTKGSTSGTSNWDLYGRTVLVGCIAGIVLIIGILATLFECVSPH